MTTTSLDTLTAVTDFYDSLRLVANTTDTFSDDLVKDIMNQVLEVTGLLEEDL